MIRDNMDTMIDLESKNPFLCEELSQALQIFILRSINKESEITKILNPRHISEK